MVIWTMFFMCYKSIFDCLLYVWVRSPQYGFFCRLIAQNGLCAIIFKYTTQLCAIYKLQYIVRPLIIHGWDFCWLKGRREQTIADALQQWFVKSSPLFSLQFRTFFLLHNGWSNYLFLSLNFFFLLRLAATYFWRQLTVWKTGLGRFRRPPSSK